MITPSNVIKSWGIYTNKKIALFDVIRRIKYRNNMDNKNTEVNLVIITNTVGILMGNKNYNLNNIKT